MIIFSGKDDMAFKKVLEIIFFLAGGVILIIVGAMFLSAPFSITIFILVILYLSSYVLIDYTLVRNIVIICGIVFVVFGVLFFCIGIRIIVKSTKKKEGPEEKGNYTNLEWLREQHYELGRSLQSIAREQGISIGEINKWMYKLDVKSAGLGEEE